MVFKQYSSGSISKQSLIIFRTSFIVFSCSAVRTYSVRPCDASCCLFWCAFTCKHDYSGKFMWRVRGRQIIMIYINLPVNKNIKICKIIISKCFCLFNRHVDFLENSWTLKKWVKKPKKWSYKLRDDGNAVLSNQICIDRVICDHGWGKNQFNIIRKSRDDTVSFGSSKLKMLQFSQGIQGPKSD